MRTGSGKGDAWFDLKEKFTEENEDYERMAKAIGFLVARADDQPTLEEVAAQVYLSPSHFQRVFSRWAGVSPKRFLQALTVERARELLKESNSVLEVADSVGLSGGSRLHDHFVQLEAVTPGEVQSGGAGLVIDWGIHETPFGRAFVAVTSRGVCRFEFLEGDDGERCLEALSQEWWSARIRECPEVTGEVVESMFGKGSKKPAPLSLHVSGTNFQVRVWKALLAIPEGKVVSYGQIAKALGKPDSSRAVGGAVGANPVAFFIPCHRVIQASGALGGYRWGVGRKQAMQAWERARIYR